MKQRRNFQLYPILFPYSYFPFILKRVYISIKNFTDFNTRPTATFKIYERLHQISRENRLYLLVSPTICLISSRLNQILPHNPFSFLLGPFRGPANVSGTEVHLLGLSNEKRLPFHRRPQKFLGVCNGTALLRLRNTARSRGQRTLQESIKTVLFRTWFKTALLRARNTCTGAKPCNKFFFPRHFCLRKIVVPEI